MTAFKAATLLLLVGSLWLALSALAAEPRVRVHVESGAFVFAPAWIRLKVHIDPDAGNRALVVEAVSDDFSTSSLEELPGDRAPRTRWIEWKDIPAGTYTVTATVTRAAARPWWASVGFTVLE